MEVPGGAGSSGGGLRERKRRETLQRVTDVAIQLFITQGFEATTLDAVTEAAGISRRTFFYYFKSKDDILLAMQSGYGDAIAAAVLNEPPDKRPLNAVRDVFIKMSARFGPEEFTKLDRLMRSNSAVMAQKQASYAQHEQKLFDALRQRWPDPKKETALRLVAMMSIGAMRLTIDAWNREGGKRPIVELLREAFKSLEAELHPTAQASKPLKKRR